MTDKQLALYIRSLKQVPLEEMYETLDDDIALLVEE